jgi:hypothetical protein
MDGPQTDLFNRARAWLLAARPTRQGLQVADAANGVLVARTYSLLPADKGSSGPGGKLWHTIKIKVQDDRYWYSLSDFQVQGTPGPATSPVTKKPARPCPLEDVVLSKPGAAKTGVSKPGSAKPAPGKPAANFAPDQVRQTINTLIADLKASML